MYASRNITWTFNLSMIAYKTSFLGFLVHAMIPLLIFFKKNLLNALNKF